MYLDPESQPPLQLCMMLNLYEGLYEDMACIRIKVMRLM